MLRGSAAIVLIALMTGHGTTALHALLVRRHGGHAVGELGEQERGDR